MAEIFTVDMSETHKGFSSPSFVAFVIDFFGSLGRDVSEKNTEDLFTDLFSSRELYREFLLYCKNNDYSFLEREDNKHMNATIFLLAFEQAREAIADGVRKSVIEILGFETSVVDLLFANEVIPGTQITYLHGLIHATYRKNMLNSHGEVIYYVGDEFGYQKVYSRERGLHHVDETGSIISLIESHRVDRQEMLDEIEENLQDALLLTKPDLSAEEEDRLLCLMTEYEDDTKKTMLGETLDEIQFRSWLWQKYHESLKMWEDLKSEDPRKTILRAVTLDNNGENQSYEPGTRDEISLARNFKIVQ